MGRVRDVVLERKGNRGTRPMIVIKNACRGTIQKRQKKAEMGKVRGKEIERIRKGGKTKKNRSQALPYGDEDTRGGFSGRG